MDLRWPMFLKDKWKVWLRWISNNEKLGTNNRLRESQGNPWRIGCRIKCNSWAVWNKIQQLSFSIANILQIFFNFLCGFWVWSRFELRFKMRKTFGRFPPDFFIFLTMPFHESRRSSIWGLFILHLMSFFICLNFQLS